MIRRGSRRSRYARRERNVDYMLWVKTLACCAAELGKCEGEIEADHAGRRGLGQKCPDEETIPLCTKHHRERTDFSGAFRSWDRNRMRAWLLECIARVQQLWLDRQGDQLGSPHVQAD